MSRRVRLLVSLMVLSATPAAAWSQQSEDPPGSRLEATLKSYGIDLQEWADESLPGAYGRVGGAFDTATSVLNAGAAAANLRRSYEALGGSCDIDVSAANTPRVPSSCAGSEDCGACFEQAQRKLNRVRVTLERLRCIGVRTKAMKEDAMAVGESFASFPGMGLGWYGARRNIASSWQGFISAYDSKYRELLRSLETALIEIGRCEAQHFDEPDWYYRYGFIYHQFMEDSYHPRSVLE